MRKEITADRETLTKAMQEMIEFEQDNCHVSLEGFYEPYRTERAYEEAIGCIDSHFKDYIWDFLDAAPALFHLYNDGDETILFELREFFRQEVANALYRYGFIKLTPDFKEKAA